MDFVLDLVVEIIFGLFMEGSLEASMNSKVHPVIRFLLLSVIILIYGGLVYLALKLAIEEKSLLALLCAVIITIIVVLAIKKKYDELKKERKE